MIVLVVKVGAETTEGRRLRTVFPIETMDEVRDLNELDSLCFLADHRAAAVARFDQLCADSNETLDADTITFGVGFANVEGG